MSFKDRGSRAKAKPVMNVTPLVDVVLVLLIIFMVVLPAMDEQVRLEIPGVTQPDEARSEQQERNVYTLAITASGAYYLDSQPIPTASVESQLRAAHRAAPTKRLILRGDRTLSYGSVRRVFATAQNIGFPGVLLRVNRREATAQVAQGD